jgi:hypothetical protein
MQCLESHALHTNVASHEGVDLYLFSVPTTCSELMVSNYAQGTRYLSMEILAGETDGAPRAMGPGTYPINTTDLAHLTVAYVFEETPQCKADNIEGATSGTITITAIDDKKVNGSFALVFNGASVSGTFDTWFCGDVRGDAGAPKCTP